MALYGGGTRYTQQPIEWKYLLYYSKASAMYSSSTIIATFTTIHSQLIQLKERAGGFRIIIIIIFFFSIRIVLSSKHCIIPLFIFSYFIVGMCSSCFSFSRLLILLLLFFYIHQTTWKWLHELYCSCCRRFANTCGRQTKPFFFPLHPESAFMHTAKAHQRRFM